MMRVLAISATLLSLMPTAASAQDAHDAFVDLCLANRDTARVREAVRADGWVETSEEFARQARSLMNLTTEVWTRPSRGRSAPSVFIAFGRIPGAEYGSPLPADVCFVVAPGTTVAQATARIERATGLASNGGAGVWMVSRSEQGFQPETALVTAAPDMMAQAVATRDVRMLAAIPGNGLAIYLQMIPVAAAD